MMASIPSFPLCLFWSHGTQQSHIGYDAPRYHNKVAIGFQLVETLSQSSCDRAKAILFGRARGIVLFFGNNCRLENGLIDIRRPNRICKAIDKATARKICAPFEISVY
uniref:Putative secreted protein n=1 Tax=Ixodes ricinus TaxID=34613 RepID=A0A6B0UI82_IXORI